jgi:hypothetical protein
LAKPYFEALLNPNPDKPEELYVEDILQVPQGQHFINRML